jgi:glycosyltransferase involved in cell wall biosynthesis
MPVLNAEKYVGTAIQSILSQTYRDFELLVIDDGSTDRTAEIVRSFRDHRIQHSTNPGNMGVVFTLNKGLKSSRGEFICRMDADDIAKPERIAHQIEYLDAHPDIMLLGTACDIIDEFGKRIGCERYPATHDEIMRTIFVHNPFCHGTVLIRASVLKEVGDYDSRFLHNEDYDLWLRIASRHLTANLDEPLVMRRLHGGNITVAKERELVRYRFRTLSHAIFKYYKRPPLAVHLVRPALAYVHRMLRELV